MRQYRGCQGPFPDGRVEILQKCPEAHVGGIGLSGRCGRLIRAVMWWFAARQRRYRAICVAENSLRYGSFREEDSFFFVPPDGVEVVDMLEKASTVLNPVEKMIVDMSYFGGIPLDMQSNILGLSRNAVRKRRYVALKKMRNVLIPDSNEAVNDATVA